MSIFYFGAHRGIVFPKRKTYFRTPLLRIRPSSFIRIVLCTRAPYVRNLFWVINPFRVQKKRHLTSHRKKRLSSVAQIIDKFIYYKRITVVKREKSAEFLSLSLSLSVCVCIYVTYRSFYENSISNRSLPFLYTYYIVNLEGSLTEVLSSKT